MRTRRYKLKGVRNSKRRFLLNEPIIVNYDVLAKDGGTRDVYVSLTKGSICKWVFRRLADSMLDTRAQWRTQRVGVKGPERPQIIQSTMFSLYTRKNV